MKFFIGFVTIILVLSFSLWTNTSKTEAAPGDQTTQEAEGKVIWEKLQSKQASCADLSNGDFEALGEYFMGQRTGASHESMDAMMDQMIGENATKQMHLTMGKRISGCYASAPFPPEGIEFMNMMGMTGGLFSPNGYDYLGGYSGFAWILMVLFAILVVAGIVLLIRRLARARDGSSGEKPSLEILKERYAKGEIDRNEFEEKRKDLI
jgi:uncharacterized membrane protein